MSEEPLQSMLTKLLSDFNSAADRIPVKWVGVVLVLDFLSLGAAMANNVHGYLTAISGLTGGLVSIVAGFAFATGNFAIGTVVPNLFLGSVCVLLTLYVIRKEFGHLTGDDIYASILVGIMVGAGAPLFLIFRVAFDAREAFNVINAEMPLVTPDIFRIE